MPIAVRPASDEDLDALTDVAARTFALACPPDAPQADIRAFIATHLSREAFAGYLADADRALAVAESDGRVVGYTMLIFSPPAPDIARQLQVPSAAELSKIYVDPDHHGGGAARALFAHALDQVRERGREAIWLGTNEANERAQRFYAKSGFQRVGHKRFRLGSRWEDDYVYERQLGHSSNEPAPPPPERALS